jgi:squalene-associated FAD-dependent desaturase
MTGSTDSIVVIGGGLAGISAAIDLAESGLPVALIESRPWLGGATCSFVRRGMTIDNGQHVLLRCFTAYRRLLDKLGVASAAAIQPALDLAVLADGSQARLRRSALPAPLHLIRSLASYQLLAPAERARLAVGCAALACQSVSARRAGSEPFGDWLERLGQHEHARRAFWDVLGLLALNVPADEADLGLVAGLVRNACMTRRDGADIGVPALPLSRLHAGPATELLGRLGATIRLGTRVVALAAGPRGGYRVRVSDTGSGEGGCGTGAQTISADGVVLAVPAWQAAALAPADLSAEAARWARLEPSPLISLHVSYGSRVTRLPFAAALAPAGAGDGLRWIVDKTSAAGLGVGQYLAVSVLAADDYVDRPASELRAEFLPWLEELFPAAADACVEDFFVTRERRATIRQVPGARGLRAAQQAGLPGFALAGAWTDTGWPDSMEGAVRSGLTAARKVLADLTAAPRPDVAAGLDARADLGMAAVPALRR